MRHFLVDFFFGPCLDISAVNPRQDQEAPNHCRHRSHNRNNHQERKQQQSKPRNRNSERSLHHDNNNGSSTKKNGRKGKSNAALSLDLVRLHTPTRNSPRGKSETTTRRRRRRLGGGILAKYNNNGGAASKYGAHYLSSRSDDASVMNASLVETYRAYSTEITDSEISNTTSEEYLEEQSVIRRSLKDHAGNHRGENTKKKKKEKEVAPRLKCIAEYNEHDDDENAAITSAQQQQSQQVSTTSTNKSELANWIEKTTTTTPQCTASTNIEYDNVTTISQASKNAYNVLGVSQHSSSRVIDLSYQAKIKDAKVQQHQQHQLQQQQQQRGCHYQGDEGGNKYSSSEKAIADVTNAYRRIKADIQRQEQEEILRQQQQQQNLTSSQQKNTNSNNSSRQRQRSTAFTDSNQRGVKSNNSSSSSSSQKNTHHIKYNNNHTDDIDDEEEEEVGEEDDNSSSSAKTRISKRLKDHRELVHDLFAKHNKRSSKNNVTGTNSSSDGDGVGGGDANAITTLQQSITNQTKAMAEMKLVPIEAGANNINEQKQTIQNSCFYLSLAASYLCGVGAFDITTTATTATTSVRDNTTTTANNHITTDNGVDHGSSSDSTIAVLEKRQKVITMNLALQLKRAIESAVLLVHPDWAKSGMVGEEIQAFSDFLVYALDSNSVLGHWAIAVFDEASGFVDVYRGRHYGKIYPPTKKRILSSNNSNSNSSSSSSKAERVRWSYKDCNETIKRGNTLTLRYIPGHYQPLLPEMVTNKVKFDKQALSSSIEMNNTASHIGDHLRSNRPTLEDILSTLDKWNVLHCVTDGRA